MRLNCALASNFLLVSAVLAGNRQPPFLDRVEKPSNSTDLQTNFWAGGIWQAELQVQAVETADGTFTVPSAWGMTGLGFDIAIGIRGYAPCHYSTLGVGITVKVTQNGAVYQAWGRWTEVDMKTAPDGKFLMSPGDQIRAVVHTLTPTSGAFILINLKTDQIWGGEVTGPRTRCNQDAAWVVSTTLGQHQPLPNFGVVGFTGIRAIISGLTVLTLRTVDITYAGRPITHTSIIADDLIIRYLP